MVGFNTENALHTRRRCHYNLVDVYSWQEAQQHAHIVVTPTEGSVVKPGRVVVLLDGAATPIISFKLMNLRV